MTRTGQEVDTAPVEIKHLHTTLQAHEGKLASQDLDVDEAMTELNEELAYLERLKARARRVKKNYARTCATIVQTDAEYFRIMCKLMDPLTLSCPSHPLVQQWVKVRAIWSEQLLTKN